MIQKIKKKLKRKLRLEYLKLFGKVECNICDWKDLRFKSDFWHPNSICPNCNSQVRQRLFVGIIQNLNDFSIQKIIKDKNVLHFAPDKGLIKILKPNAQVYKTADLLADGYSYSHIDYNIDMTNMSIIKDSEYDCVIAFDVLEHIPDHLSAIRETNRVLKKGGYCIFMVPQKDNLEHTIEDLTIKDPKKREELFGQWDHWRIYGSDFKKMIADQGFDVTVVDESFLDKNIVFRNVLYPPIPSEHPLATNNRKVYFGLKV